MAGILTRAAKLDRVRYRYPSAATDAVSDVTWSIEAGSFTIVTGPSGSGKSTQLKLLNGLVPHFTGGTFGGTVTVAGSDTRLTPTRDLSCHIGFVFQEPDGLSIGGRVDDEISFGLEQVGTPVPVMRRSVEEAMTLLDIEHLRSRSVATLSGGERQRVAIAAAMATSPGMLVLDEPTSQLDPVAADDLVRTLQRLNEDHGVTVVVSEHRLERFLPHADHLRLLLPDEEPIGGAPRAVLAGAGVRFAPSLFRAAQALRWEPLPLSVKEGRALYLEHCPNLASVPTREAPASGQVLLRVHRGQIRYDERPILRDIDLELRQGEVVALMGPNGSGKTTLLRAIAGLHALSAGEIVVGDKAAVDPVSGKSGRRIGFLPQRARALLFNETVRKEIAFSLDHRERGSSVAESLLREFDLTTFAASHPFDLSIGEQERVALATTLAGDPPIVLLDEPTRGLDSVRKQHLAASLMSRARNGQAIMVATHDAEFAASIATGVLLLGGGEIIARGTPHEVLDGSLVYGTQINKVFGHGLLTLPELFQAAGIPDISDTANTTD